MPSRAVSATSLNRPARLNRSLLAIVGIVLLAAGGFTLATHFGWLRVLDPAAPLLPGTDAPPTWVLVITAAVAITFGLLCLRWLAAQLTRRPKTHTWRLERDPTHGRTELAARTATAPLTDEISTYPGVHAAHATLAGTRAAPVLALVISAEQDADLTEIRHRLDTHNLPRLRHALDPASLPVTLEFRFTTTNAPAPSEGPELPTTSFHYRPDPRESPDRVVGRAFRRRGGGRCLPIWTLGLIAR